MSTTIFFCADEPKSVFRMALSALGDFLQQNYRDERAAAQILSLTNRLWTIVADNNRHQPGSHHRHRLLFHATDALYQAAGELFHDPTSKEHWRMVIEHHHRCCHYYDAEMAAWRNACG